MQHDCKGKGRWAKTPNDFHVKIARLDTQLGWKSQWMSGGKVDEEKLANQDTFLGREESEKLLIKTLNAQIQYLPD